MSAPETVLLRRVRQADPAASLVQLAGDASRRRYWRLSHGDGRTRVVMDYGEPFDGETDDVRLARLFSEAGLPVAQVFETWPVEGCLVLEDLGDETLERVLEATTDPAERYVLLERAVALAAEIAERGTPVLKSSDRAAGPSLDTSRFVWEMDFFVEHYVGALWGHASPPPGVRDALHELAGLAAAAPQVMCHRDFHSRNILVRPDGQLAMVDIQDARWGPDAYDLASLLRDAYAEIDQAWITPLVERYLAELAVPPQPGAFRRRFELVAAQRMIKALGTFGYQVAVRGDSRYAPPIPRTLARLRDVLPALQDVPQVAERFGATGLLEIPPNLPEHAR